MSFVILGTFATRCVGIVKLTCSRSGDGRLGEVGRAWLVGLRGSRWGVYGSGSQGAWTAWVLSLPFSAFWLDALPPGDSRGLIGAFPSRLSLAVIILCVCASVNFPGHVPPRLVCRPIVALCVAAPARRAYFPNM